MKLSAVEAISKFYYDKGFRNVDIQLKEEQIAYTEQCSYHYFLLSKKEIK